MLVPTGYYLIGVVFRIAFENEQPQVAVIFLDVILNLIYLVDMFRCFTHPFMQNGRRINNRRAIAVNYVKTWFLVDIYCFYPLALVNYFNWDKDWNGKSDERSLFILFITQNFRRSRGLYMVMLFFHLARARNFFKYIKFFLKQLDISIEFQNLTLTFIYLMYMLHITACFWYSAAQLS